MHTLLSSVWNGAGEAARSFPIVLAFAFVFRIARFPDIGLTGSMTIGAATLIALLKANWPLPLALVMASLSGVLTGLLNAILFVWFRVSPFLSGILTMSVAYATGFWILGRQSDVSVSGVNGYYSEWVCLALSCTFALALLIFLSTRTGMKFRFAGEQPELFHLLGKRPHRFYGATLMLGGITAAFGGAVYAGVSAHCNINPRPDFLLNSMVALVLGDAARAGAHWLGTRRRKNNQQTSVAKPNWLRLLEALVSGTSSLPIFLGALIGVFAERILYQVTITYIPAQTETNAIVDGIAVLAVICMSRGQAARYLQNEWRFNDTLR